MDFYRKVGEFAYMSYNVHGHMKMNISANDMMTGENDFLTIKYIILNLGGLHHGFI